MLTFLTIAYSLAHYLFRRFHLPVQPLFVLILANLFLFSSISFTKALSRQQEDPAKSILITEVFYNTPGVDAEEEWIELSNFSSESIDLSNYKVGDEEQSQGKEGMLRFPQGSMLNPGQTIIIAQLARGFHALYAHEPDYEIKDSDPQVPDMRRFALWSTGEFALANDGDELLLLNDRSRIIDAINYGDKTTYFDPAISSVYTNQSIERAPASCDTDSAANWHPSRSPTPGTVNLEGECFSTASADEIDEGLLPIGQIQGVGDVSPYTNQEVSFQGVVTGRLEDRNSAGITFYTIFVQDVPGQEDADSNTSDAIAVFFGRKIPPYEIGDILQISGQVTEFYGLTEIDDSDLSINLASSDNPLPEATLFDLAQDTVGLSEYLESKESMLVSVAEPARVVGPTHSGCGFALIDAYTDHAPLPRRAVDDLTGQPILILNNSDVDCQDLPDLKTGDLVSTIYGPMTYHFDQYKIVLQDTDTVEISPAPWPELPRPLQSSRNQFTIATFNLNNHFDGTRDMPASAEPIISATDLAEKQRKLAFTLGETSGCPTIVGLQEIENEQLLGSLAAEIALHCGFTYDISHRESSDGRGLDLAFLTDPRRIELGAIDLHQACTTINTGINDLNAHCSPTEYPLFSRPPLRVELQVDGHPYTIINNHFKSKRGGEVETAARRLQQAQHVASLVATQLADDPHARIIVLGDFNDYEKSATMQQLTVDAGLVNVLEQVPERDRYTYIFDGLPQLIDGILVSHALLHSIEGVMIIHANADYPVGLALDTSSAGIQFHSSDHDLPLVLLNLPQDELPVQPTPQPTPIPTLTLDPATPTAQPPLPTDTITAKPPLWPVVLIVLAAVALILLILWRKK